MSTMPIRMAPRTSPGSGKKKLLSDTYCCSIKWRAPSMRDRSQCSDGSPWRHAMRATPPIASPRLAARVVRGTSWTRR